MTITPRHSITASGSARRHNGNERGAILVEAVIVFGLLIAVFLALFDMYALSTVYMDMNQIAREGILTGAGNNYFKGTSAASTCTGVEQVDLQKNAQSYENCRDAGGSEDLPTCGHYIVHWRVQKAVEALASSNMPASDISIGSTCTQFPGAPSQFQVTISGMFNGVSPFFKSSPVVVRQLGLVR